MTDKRESSARSLARRVPRSVFVPFAKWPSLLKGADILVNATPVGLKSKKERIVHPRQLDRRLFVYDLVYSNKTALVRDARGRGLKAFDGSGMLLAQGLIAFEILTGRKAPERVMEKALVASLKKGSD